MKSTFISREKNEVKFTMEFTAEEFEEAIVKVYQKEKDKFQIDGFRKGKAPRSLIEKRYGEGIFFEDAVNNLISLNLCRNRMMPRINVMHGIVATKIALIDAEVSLTP